MLILIELKTFSKDKQHIKNSHIFQVKCINSLNFNHRNKYSPISSLKNILLLKKQKYKKNYSQLFQSITNS